MRIATRTAGWCGLLVAVPLIVIAPAPASVAAGDPSAWRGWVVVDQDVSPEKSGNNQHSHWRSTGVDVSRTTTTAAYEADGYIAWDSGGECRDEYEAANTIYGDDWSISTEVSDIAPGDPLYPEGGYLSVFRMMPNLHIDMPGAYSKQCGQDPGWGDGLYTGWATGAYLHTGTQWRAEDYDAPPETVGASQHYWNGAAEITQTVCMTQSTVDTDGDGLPDPVDRAPTISGSKMTLGAPQDSWSHPIGPRYASGVVGVGGVPSCPTPTTTNHQAPTFDWSMPATTKDSNGDGRPDDYIDGNRTADVPADGKYDVKLNACGNSATSYTWAMSSPDGGNETVGPIADCQTTVRLAEGPWNVTLTITPASGGPPVSAGQTIQVRNYLIVSLGDSFASGEGNPDKVFVDNHGGGHPTWQMADCDRSAYAAPAITALRLEKASAQSSVTFIHLACSGATVTHGMLGKYKGVKSDGHTNPVQVKQAASLTHGQRADIVTVSMGGNDIGFSDIIKKCLFHVSCYDDNATIDHTSGTIHQISQKLLHRLRARYSAIGTCLSTGACTLGDLHVTGSLTVDPSHVVITGYPDLTKGKSGKYCDDHGAMRADEYEWADKVVLQGVSGTTVRLSEDRGHRKFLLDENGLNPRIEKLQTSLGWTPVTHQYDTFAKHGYCADDQSWIRSISQSRQRQHGEVRGGYHPNEKGHRAIAAEMYPAIKGLLGL